MTAASFDTRQAEASAVRNATTVDQTTFATKADLETGLSSLEAHFDLAGPHEEMTPVARSPQVASRPGAN